MKAWLRKLLCRIVGHNHVYGGPEMSARTCSRCGRRQVWQRLYVWMTENPK